MAALAKAFGQRGVAEKTAPLVADDTGTPGVQALDLNIPTQEGGLTLSLEDREN